MDSIRVLLSLSNSKLTLNKEAKPCGQSTFVHIPKHCRQLVLQDHVVKSTQLHVDLQFEVWDQVMCFIFLYERRLEVKIHTIFVTEIA